MVYFIVWCLIDVLSVSKPILPKARFIFRCEILMVLHPLHRLFCLYLLQKERKKKLQQPPFYSAAVLNLLNLARSYVRRIMGHGRGGRSREFLFSAHKSQLPLLTFSLTHSTLGGLGDCANMAAIRHEIHPTFLDVSQPLWKKGIHFSFPWRPIFYLPRTKKTVHVSSYFSTL